MCDVCAVCGVRVMCALYACCVGCACCVLCGCRMHAVRVVVCVTVCVPVCMSSLWCAVVRVVCSVRAVRAVRGLPAPGMCHAARWWQQLSGEQHAVAESVRSR